jgi:hypothetical protein
MDHSYAPNRTRSSSGDSKLNAIRLPASRLPEFHRAGVADICLWCMASPGQRPRSSERRFSVRSLDCVRLCCGHIGVVSQNLVGHKALPPPPVLGYSHTLFFDQQIHASLRRRGSIHSPGILMSYIRFPELLAGRIRRSCPSGRRASRAPHERAGRARSGRT